MGFLPLSEVNVLDAFFEGLSLVAYVFVLVMLFYARKKNKIFGTKGFPVMILALLLGVVSAGMDFFTELYWFDEYQSYLLFKSLIAIFQIASLIIFGVSLLLVFRFTRLMLGEDGD